MEQRKIRVGRRKYLMYVREICIKDVKEPVALYSLDKVSWDSSPKKLIEITKRIELIIREGTTHTSFGESRPHHVRRRK